MQRNEGSKCMCSMILSDVISYQTLNTLKGFESSRVNLNSYISTVTVLYCCLYSYITTVTVLYCCFSK